jgi:hypothetical protein
MWNKQYYSDQVIKLCLVLTNRHHQLIFQLDIEMFEMMMHHINECIDLKKDQMKRQTSLFNQPWQALKKRCPSSENCPQNVGLAIDATTSPLFGNNPKG